MEVPDPAEGERQRKRRERDAEDRLDLEAFDRAAERKAREWEREMQAVQAGMEPSKR